MPRIVYYSFPAGDVQGGQKMIFRHVETLRELGFDAVCWMNSTARQPTWMQHRAPVVIDTPPQPDDVIVLPDDAPNALRSAASFPQKVVVFTQNPYTLGAFGVPAIDTFPAERPPAFIAVAPRLAELARRIYPQARAELVPCFADERIFQPGPLRQLAICHSPRKRAREATFIQNVFRKLHDNPTTIPWRGVQDAAETDVAKVFGASELFLSLSRLESVGMTPLEAMACGCICAGFTGVGGQEYATAENGFWAPEEDCEAAVEQLAAAVDLVRTGGPALQRMRDAGRATAEAWSYARFRVALEEAWMRLAPEARVKNAAVETTTPR